jgi:hypothetical protein
LNGWTDGLAVPADLIDYTCILKVCFELDIVHWTPFNMQHAVRVVGDENLPRMCKDMQNLIGSGIEVKFWPHAE